MSAFKPNQKQKLNRLLAILPDEEYTRILPNLESVSLNFREVLYEAKAPIGYVYFPINTLVSLFTIMEDSTVAEVAIVGNEGLIGLPVFLGIDTTPLKAIVQIPGEAVRIKADVFKHSVNWGSSLHYWLQRYTQALMIQISLVGACNRNHSVEQRCCHWLLRAHDSVMSNQFPLTHEVLAQMLGVRRASVTEAAGRLQKAELLRYSRGQMTILNLKGLEETSCKCYLLVKAEFESLFG